MLLKHKKHLFEVIDEGDWSALREVEAIDAEDGTPRHEWNGEFKIPMRDAAQALAFFEWSYAETKSETMVHGYYHPAHGWAFLVLPQKGYTGLSVSLLDDPEGRREAEARLPGVWDGKEPWREEFNESWKCLLTWHHHGSLKAFQSGQDEKDETTKEGLHITSGHIGDKRYSFHARVSYGQLLSEATLSDWFEVDPVLFEKIPKKLHATVLDDIIEDTLCTPPVERDFPEWWKANVRKIQPPVTHHASWTNRDSVSNARKPSRNAYSSAWDDDYVVQQNGALEHSARSYEWFVEKVLSYAEAKGIRLEDLEDAFKAMPTHLTDLVDLMVTSEISCIETDYLLEQAKREKEDTKREGIADQLADEMWGKNGDTTY